MKGIKLSEAARLIGMSEIAIGIMSESDHYSHEQNVKELRRRELESIIDTSSGASETSSTNCAGNSCKP